MVAPAPNARQSSSAGYQTHDAPVDRAHCYRHPTVPSAAHCVQCLQGLCAACTVPDADGTLCAGCLADRRAELKHKFMQAMWMSAVCLALVAFLIPRLPEKPSVEERTRARMEAVVAEEEFQHRPDGMDYGARQYDAAVLIKRLARAPCETESADALARLQVETGHVTLAKQTLEDYRRRCGASPQMRLAHAMVLNADGQTDAALLEMTAFLADYPTDAAALQARVDTLVFAGRTDEAEAAAREWSLMDPGSERPLVRLEKLADRLGRTCTALRYAAERAWSRRTPQKVWTSLHEKRAKAQCGEVDARLTWATDGATRVTFRTPRGTLEARFDASVPVTRLGPRAVKLLGATADGALRMFDGEEVVSMPRVRVRWPEGRVDRDTAVKLPETGAVVDELAAEDVVLGRDLLAMMDVVWDNAAKTYRLGVLR